MSIKGMSRRLKLLELQFGPRDVLAELLAKRGVGEADASPLLNNLPAGRCVPHDSTTPSNPRSTPPAFSFAVQ
jgi:hypothetical protein